MVTLPAGVRAALIEAGGCEHTPAPWAACDTCGRPIPPWALASGSQIAAFAWQAKTIDGLVFNKKDVVSIDNVPKDRLADLNVATSSPRAPTIRVVVDPRKGEQVGMHTRHMIRTGVARPLDGAAPPSVDKLSVVVLEVTPDPEKPDQKVRLYVHPHALILSTQDLYF